MAVGGTAPAVLERQVGAAMVPSHQGVARKDVIIILGATLGTTFEWYDFFLFGSLASTLANNFFAGLDPTAAYIFTLLAFAAGFIVRPAGAIVFGWVGDSVGRKQTFLATIIVMGFSTFAIGLVPAYSDIGIAAPIFVIALRLLQGLAIGGEYGGAATYVAEHAPEGRRGLYTSWIQTTATCGLLLSLIITFAARVAAGHDGFDRWAWRIPFLASAILLALSVWIRMRLAESPIFQRLKEDGRASRAPALEAFGDMKNLVRLVTAFVVSAGSAVVGYTGQLYCFFFLTTSVQVDQATATLLLAAALALAMPLFVLFGAVSDRIGRKRLIVGGLLISAAINFSVFSGLLTMANADLARAQATSRVILETQPDSCSFQANPIARETDFVSSCDIAKRALAQMFIPYDTIAAPAGGATILRIGEVGLNVPSANLDSAGKTLDPGSMAAISSFRVALIRAAEQAGLKQSARPTMLTYSTVVLLLIILQVPMATAYGPLAATLVELFPARIRYTSVSFPYHLGNGWVGGLLPSISFAIVASTGHILSGLWYPTAVAIAAAVICALLLKDLAPVE
jgi:MFS family permease